MTQKTKLVLCLALMLLAAVSLMAVLGSLGVLPVGAVEDDDGVLLREVDGRVGVFFPADAAERWVTAREFSTAEYISPGPMPSVAGPSP